jgi:hypothetical protein
MKRIILEVWEVFILVIVLGLGPALAVYLGMTLDITSCHQQLENNMTKIYMELKCACPYCYTDVELRETFVFQCSQINYSNYLSINCSNYKGKTWDPYQNRWDYSNGS